MKKIITTLFASLAIVLSSTAQVADVQVSTCTNDSSSIYEVLATGKVLLIASKGVDCSACRNRAGALQAWAVGHRTEVQVWGAMTRIYSNNDPDCVDLADWITLYSWSAIFTFIDDQRLWLDQGTPRYYVYDPRDSSLAYNGFSMSEAQTKSIEISTQILSTPEQRLNEVELVYGQKEWKLINLEADNYVFDIIDLSGQVIETVNGLVENNTMTISNGHLKKGLYLVRIQNNKGGANVIKAFVR